MTEENTSETNSKQKDSQAENQVSGAVKKRLTLTIVIVILMAVTAVASVYRQEIYVGVVRAITNFISGDSVTKKKSEISPQPETAEPTSREISPKQSINMHAPGQANLEHPTPATLSLSAEVEKSVTDAAKSETPPKVGGPTATLNSVPLSESINPAIPKAPESSSPLDPAKISPDSQKNVSPPKTEKSAGAKESVTVAQQTAKPDSMEAKPQTSSEQFMVPGSLTVRIENYAGTMTRWRLMVILDDSDLMAKNAKPWSPDRFVSATNFISRISSQLTVGSKLAVRDFACVRQDERAKGAPCLSRMLTDWSEAPFSGLKEKLQAAKPGGSVNSCAAAAYSMKKDFLVSDSLSPRLLIITAGGAKCNSKEVLKAAGAIGPGAKTPVDILAVGMNSRKKAAYSDLAKKTGGVFIKIDAPADMENALNKYSKTLHVTTVDRIEVRGDKVVFNINPDQDITLAPGTYTVVLPSIKGLAEFKRSVPNVRIKSGEGTLMVVKLTKGKATVKIGPK